MGRQTMYVCVWVGGGGGGEVANSIMVFAYMLVTLSTRPGVGIPMDCIWTGVVHTYAVVLELGRYIATTGSNGDMQEVVWFVTV